MIVTYPFWGKDKILNKKSVLFPSRMQFEQFVNVGSHLSSFFVPCVFLFLKFCLLLLFFMHCEHVLWTWNTFRIVYISTLGYKTQTSNKLHLKLRTIFFDFQNLLWQVKLPIKSSTIKPTKLKRFQHSLAGWRSGYWESAADGWPLQLYTALLEIRRETAVNPGWLHHSSKSDHHVPVWPCLTC